MLHYAEIWIEDRGGRVLLGNNNTICGRTQLASIEGCTLEIGSHCLFSANVQIATGDSHSVLSLSGERINPSRDVRVGSHVWFGHDTTLLKGCDLPSWTIVGACSVVTKPFQEEGTALGGNPARVVRRGLRWDIHRI